MYEAFMNKHFPDFIEDNADHSVNDTWLKGFFLLAQEHILNELQSRMGAEGFDNTMEQVLETHENISNWKYFDGMRKIIKRFFSRALLAASSARCIDPGITRSGPAEEYNNLFKALDELYWWAEDVPNKQSMERNVLDIFYELIRISQDMKVEHLVHPNSRWNSRPRQQTLPFENQPNLADGGW